MHLPLVVITDFDVIRVAIREAEANTPLVVDRYCMLALPLASESVEPVPGWGLKVIEPSRQIHILEFADRPTSHIRRDPTRRSLHKPLGRPLVRESLDHVENCNASRDACQALRARLNEGSHNALEITCGPAQRG
jgi:hypothetical protein